MKRKIAKSKKTGTAAKSVNTVKAGHPVLLLTEKIEKEFLTVPAKLASLCKKEYLVLKKEELKLKASLKKATAKQKILEKKQSALIKTSHTVAGRKKVAAGKKTLSQATSAIKLIIGELALITRIRLQLQAKQAKFTLMRKELSQVEKRLKKQLAEKKLVTVKKSSKASALRSKRKPERSTDIKLQAEHTSDNPVTSAPAELVEIS